ncbi:DUF3426 domain-containing protein [Phenylobacterium sp.]|jgi:predicted Zn finger-like uncharacterized protein|uniref:DUF3426 domain-containing protein n=1 Tax=Phenylobacterium sp. TaxID=1871053 RepID=UPI002E306D74|nr:DUF3426 domain-containing protein [Phenylobacterium sp.]HEX2561168.1 DUF3426 domain-containing protein [Phenylobacterium sp.]
MILTCPDCATSYFVDAAKIPPDGRTVKCSSCGKRWTAHAEPELELVEGEDEAAQAPRDADEIEFEEAPLAELPGEALPKVFRAKTETSRRMRELVTVGVVWAGMAAVIVLTIGAALVFRVDVVRLWPRTAAAYASVGMPVNQLGLAIEGLTVETALKDGHAAYSVTGTIRNVEGRTITSPPLKMILVNKDGRPLVTKIARPADPRIPPGQSRHFGLIIPDPPSTAAELEVSFATAMAPGSGQTPMAAHVKTEGAGSLSLRKSLEPAPAVHAPGPAEAQPLPADSAHALTPHG